MVIHSVQIIHLKLILFPFLSGLPLQGTEGQQLPPPGWTVQLDRP